MKLKNLLKLENILIIITLISLVIYFLYIYNNNNLYEYDKKKTVTTIPKKPIITKPIITKPIITKPIITKSKKTATTKKKQTNSNVKTLGSTISSECSDALDTLDTFCSAAKRASRGNCFVCVGQHQQSIKQKCENIEDIIDNYCGSTTPTSITPSSTTPTSITPSSTTSLECSNALDKLCGGARRASAGNCLVCVGQHQSIKQKCESTDIDNYCNTSNSTRSPNTDNNCIQKLKNNNVYPNYNTEPVKEQIYNSIRESLDFTSTYSNDINKYKTKAKALAALKIQSGEYNNLFMGCINNANDLCDSDAQSVKICGRWSDQISPIFDSVISKDGSYFKSKVDSKCGGYFDENNKLNENDITGITNKGIETMNKCFKKTDSVNTIIANAVSEASTNPNSYKPDKYIKQALDACTTCSEQQASLGCEPLETVINYKDRCYNIALQSIPDEQGKVFNGPIAKCTGADSELKTKIEEKIKDIYYPIEKYNEAKTNPEKKQELIKNYCYPQLNNTCNIYKLNEDPFSSGDINGHTISNEAKLACEESFKNFEREKDKYTSDDLNPTKICENFNGEETRCTSIKPMGDYFMGCKYDKNNGECTPKDIPGCTKEGSHNYRPYYTVDDGSCISEQTLQDINYINNDHYNGALSNCSEGEVRDDVFYPSPTGEGHKCPSYICRYALCDPNKNEMLSLWRNQNRNFQSAVGGYSIQNGNLGSIINKCLNDGTPPSCELPVKNNLNNSTKENSNRIPICNIVWNGNPNSVLSYGAFSNEYPICGTTGCNLTNAGLAVRRGEDQLKINLDDFNKEQYDEIKRVENNYKLRTGACYQN